MQLTSLRPTADAFCANLRDALKIELSKGNMKLTKGFSKSCYSESLLNSSDDASANVGDSQLLDLESHAHAGLGVTYKFPGDPRKCGPQHWSALSY